MKKFSDKLEQEIREAANVDERARREQTDKQIAAINAVRPAEPPRAYIWHEDTPAAPATRLFKRGDPRTPLGEVAPGLPTVLAQYPLDPPKPTGKSTGRRLWLAHWMTRPDNPLVARVMANRIWQHHFGEGIVASENDFGIQGDRPSHPELLDWLAAEFMASGWRMKPLHRMIVLSNTYQQASRNAELGLRNTESASENPQSAIRDPQSSPQSLDPDNRLLSHWRQRRVEAEVVRDSALAVSGQLNLETGGPSMYPTLPRAVLEGQSRPGEGWGKSDERQAARRSIYIFVKRVLAVPELDLLDAPDNTSSCEQRAVSTVAPQALTFLNGEFINQQARHFADRLVRDAGQDVKAQITRAFEQALCRSPRPDEMTAAIEFLTVQQRQIESDARAAGQEPGDVARRALAALCLVVLNTSEFVYVD